MFEGGTMNIDTMQFVHMILTGVIGKIIVDQLKKVCKKVNITVTPWLIRAITIPVAYLVLLGYTQISGQSFNQELFETLAYVMSTALTSIAINETVTIGPKESKENK